LYSIGHTFFTFGPYPADQPLVYLLKGKSNQVVNIARSQPVLAEYARIAGLKTDAEAAVELVRLYTHLQMDERTTNAYTAPYVVADDVKRYYPHLDTRGEAFKKMLDELRPMTFKAVQAATDSDTPFLQAVWLGSFLPEADRKKLVTFLIAQYEENAKKIVELEKISPQPSREVAPPPNAGANVGGGGGNRLPTPLEMCYARGRFLVTGMILLMDPSWHDRIAKVQTVGCIFPWDFIPNAPEIEAKTLAKAKEFVAG
jgi:hypothetical protein